ncbi:MAG: RNA-binding protein [Spirochaetales bacterium]|nr:RNA-binding protein [Spirochaetales bacterium]
MSKKIYVGNMNYDTTENQLQELFAQHGSVVEVNIVRDRYTNRPKGFAFVEMEKEEEANAAISALNNTELDGRALRVNEAHAKKPRQNSFSY